MTHLAIVSVVCSDLTVWCGCVDAARPRAGRRCSAVVAPLLPSCLQSPDVRVCTGAQICKKMLTDMQYEQVNQTREYQKLFAEKEVRAAA
jgi:hypothetical protein